MRDAVLFCAPSQVKKELTQQEVDPGVHSLLLHLSCLISCFPSFTTLISLSLQEFEYAAKQTALGSSCAAHSPCRQHQDMQNPAESEAKTAFPKPFLPYTSE